jgi:hypothetical protein
MYTGSNVGYIEVQVQDFRVYHACASEPKLLHVQCLILGF